MQTVSLNPSGKLDIKYQINRDGELLFVFVDEDEDGVETDHDVTGSTWELFVKRYIGDRLKTISITLGAGLSFPVYTTNQLLASTDAADTRVEEGDYYFELYDITNKQTKVSGRWFFRYDPQEGGGNGSTIKVSILATTVKVAFVTTAINNNLTINGGDAANVTFNPAQGIAATNVQAAIEEVVVDGDVKLALKQNLVNSATALVDGATIDLTAIKHTLATATSRTFTISYTGDDITLEVTLSATSATQTFPATALCVSEGVASGDNTLAMSGVSGDKYMIAIKKVGSAYYVVGKNFGQ